MTRYLICGGRDFNDAALVEKALNALILHPEDSVVIHGAARGADRLAGDWARRHDAAVIAIPADWDRFGKAAGPIRNSLMLTDQKPDVVIAFPGGDGTADMVAKARRARLVVICVTGTDDPPGWAAVASGDKQA